MPYSKDRRTVLECPMDSGRTNAWSASVVDTKPLTGFSHTDFDDLLVGFDGTYGDSPHDWRIAIKEGRQAGSTLTVNVVYVKPTRLFLSGHTAVTGSTYRRRETEYPALHPMGDISWRVSSAPSVTVGKANSLALERFVSSARSKQTQVQGQVIAGEAIKTLRMMRNPLRSLFTQLQRYQRDVRRRARTLWQRWHRLRETEKLTLRNLLGSTWLEYAFGWAPLVHDIDDMSMYLAGLSAQHPKGAFCVGRGEHANQTNGGNVSFSNDGQIAPRMRYTKVCTSTVTVVYKGLLRASTDFQSWDHKDLGFTLSEFVPTVWELIPYSFLVDYFTNFGEVVSAVSYPRSNFRWIMKWTITDRKDELLAPWMEPGSNPLGKNKAIGDPCSVVTRQIVRAPYYGSLIPDFRFEIPGLSMKWLNLAALAANRL